MLESKFFSIGIITNDFFSLYGLCSYLNKNLRFSTKIWCTSSEKDIFKKCNSSPPDVLLVEMYMSSISSLNLIYNLRKNYSKIIIIAITSLPVEDYAYLAAIAGTQSIVSKNDPKNLLDILTDIKNELFVPKDINGIHFDNSKIACDRLQVRMKTTYLSLSKREKEVIELFATGFTADEICKQLHITKGTVETFINRACRKLHVKNRNQLIAELLHEQYWFIK